MSDPASQFARRTAAEGECLVWTGPLDKDGYGRSSSGKFSQRAHRMAWVLANGPVPDGMVVRHTCDNRRCVRIEHLQIGTPADNNRDRAERGRSCVGVDHHSARLTPDQVRSIRQRARAGESVQKIAQDFAVRPWTVQKIRDGLTWRSVA